MPKAEEDRVYDPPGHLSDRAKAIWREVQPRRCVSAERRTLFQLALECLDRADQARAAIDKDGLTVTTKTTGAVHVHPLTKIERDSQAQFARIWGQLVLEWWAPLDGSERRP